MGALDWMVKEDVWGLLLLLACVMLKSTPRTICLLSFLSLVLFFRAVKNNCGAWGGGSGRLRSGGGGRGMSGGGVISLLLSMKLAGLAGQFYVFITF